MVKRTHHKKPSRKGKKYSRKSSRKHKSKGKGLTPDIENQYDKISTYKYLPNFRNSEQSPDIENQLGNLHLRDHRNKMSSALYNINKKQKNTTSTPPSSNDYGQFVDITLSSRSSSSSSKARGVHRKSRKSRKMRKSRK
jgi:hypothetical protein